MAWRCQATSQCLSHCVTQSWLSPHGVPRLQWVNDLTKNGHNVVSMNVVGMNPKVGIRVPLRSRHFLSKKLWHFHNNIRSSVENECCCLRTVNISNGNFIIKTYLYRQSQYSKTRGQQMSGPDSSNESIRHDSEGWEFESPSGRDIFCLKNVDTFTRTSVRVSKMNAVAHAQLTFQMIILLQKQIHWDFLST